MTKEVLLDGLANDASGECFFVLGIVPGESQADLVLPLGPTSKDVQQAYQDLIARAVKAKIRVHLCSTNRFLYRL